MYVLVAALWLTSIGLAVHGDHEVAVPLFAYAVFGTAIVLYIGLGVKAAGRRRED